MTKFDGNAIGQRDSRRKGLTAKEHRKYMETFQKTGLHPDEQQAQGSDPIPLLPDRELSRPHVFFEFAQGGRTLGRCVVEVFEDQVPVVARLFINRCQQGSADTYQGTLIHRLVPDLAAYGGTSTKYQAGSLVLKRNRRLRHVAAGAVSISLSGAEFAICLARALPLDDTHQVVGRVHLGREVLDALNCANIDVHDAPQPRIVVAKCGTTNAEGTYESLDEAAQAASKRNDTPEQAAARLEAEGNQTRSALMEALQTGLSGKRKAEASAGAAVQNKLRSKAGMLSNLLGDESDSDSSGSDPSQDAE